MSVAERFTAALEARHLTARAVGPAKWLCQCPGHEDRTPSLSVAEGAGGRLLLHCLAGCDTEDIVAAVGWAMGDLFEPDLFNSNGSSASTSNGKAGASGPGPTTSANGKAKAAPAPPAEADVERWHATLVGNPEACGRLEQLRGWSLATLKRFQIGLDASSRDRPIVMPVRDGDGVLVGPLYYQPNSGKRRGGSPKVKGSPGAPRELFPAPERVGEGAIWIVEGEPDALSLHSLGLPASGVPGANGWRPEWASRFAGRGVIVCTDCDREGRKLAQRVAKDLLEHANGVRIVDLGPDRDDGHDVGALAAEAENEDERLQVRELLKAEAAAAKPLTDGRAGSNGAAPRGGPAGKLRRLDVARMAREDPPPVPWVIEGLVVRGALTVLNGREGEGKSLLAMALAAGVIHGESNAGMTCVAGRVLIVDTENGEYETHRRVHALGLPGTVEFYEPEGGQRFDLRSDLGELDRLLVAHKPDLLVLDSFRTLWGGEENDSGDVAKVLDPLRNLVRKHQAGALLLHHSGKANAGYRGSSAIGASAELGFTLARADGDEDRDRRSLTCWKCRPAPKPGRAWLRLSVERGMVLIDRADPPEEEEPPKKVS